jgi:hypothetical protein
VPAGQEREALGGFAAGFGERVERGHQLQPLHGFHVSEVLLDEHSAAVGRPLGSIQWPHGHIPVSILHHRVLREADPRLTLAADDRVNLLAKRHGGGEGRGERSDAPLAADNAGSA